MASDNGYRKMVCLDEALRLVDRMRKDFYDALPAEAVPVDEATGRKLAADVVALKNMPGYDLCTMDGYALRTSDGYPLRIAGEALAGRDFGRLKHGEAVYVTTGARLPEGANAVLQVEDAVISDGLLNGVQIGPWTNVVRAGSDLKAGGVLLPKGNLITPAMAGAFHVAGVERLVVYRKPRVAVIATGDEIRDGTVPDANGPMVCALLESWGCVPARKAPIGDSGEELAAGVDDALASHDFVITIGGVSMGRMDKVSSVVEEGDVIFKGIRMKPGKPFIASYRGGKPVFSLPGKPSGSYTAMELLIKRFVQGPAKAAAVNLPVSRDVALQSPDFDYVIFVELCDGEARPVGYPGSSLELLRGAEYNTSLLSTSARTTLADGYFIAHGFVKAGQPVSINLSR
ncbi:MAG: molybdopterin biosynthesis protein MoeA [Methanocella sp. PtaU1.Bin125]|nr:MAG: molybdopterin biosynthesis protein MoeA [Methanocella sp. PtaU1.Bin125]